LPAIDWLDSSTIVDFDPDIERRYRDLNISVKSDYAVRAMFDLASEHLRSARTGSSVTPVKIGDIAKRQKVPQKFLELILAGLKQAGLVESRRGAEGGYLLARSPDKITIGDVLRTTEVNDRGSISRDPDSPFGEVWDRVDNAVNGVLDETRFASVVDQWQEKHSAYVPNWDI
jgi:Rrf2 family transcriptional regulator, cysteine metabolism repressor